MASPWRPAVEAGGYIKDKRADCSWTVYIQRACIYLRRDSGDRRSRRRRAGERTGRS